MKFLTFTVVVRVVVAIVHHCVSSVLDVFFLFFLMFMMVRSFLTHICFHFSLLSALFFRCDTSYRVYKIFRFAFIKQGRSDCK